MCPNASPQRQTGAGLPIALFIITVLALLVFGMAQLQQSSGEAVSLQIQSQRAFFAAESGMQVGVTNVLASEPAQCFAGTLVFSEPGLSGCSAEITCDLASGNVVRLRSTGTCGAGLDRASRVIEVGVQ